MDYKIEITNCELRDDIYLPKDEGDLEDSLITKKANIAAILKRHGIVADIELSPGPETLEIMKVWREEEARLARRDAAQIGREYDLDRL